MAETCPFCERIAHHDVDPYYSDDRAVTFPPLNPVTRGHLLVVSRSHIHNVGEDPMTAGRVMEMAARIARSVGDCNIITSTGPAATMTVRHLHLHVVPRRDGDGLKLPWSDG